MWKCQTLTENAVAAFCIVSTDNMAASKAIRWGRESLPNQILLVQSDHKTWAISGLVQRSCGNDHQNAF